MTLHDMNRRFWPMEIMENFEWCSSLLLKNSASQPQPLVVGPGVKTVDQTTEYAAKESGWELK